MSNRSRRYAPAATSVLVFISTVTLTDLIGCNSAPPDADEGLKSALFLGADGLADDSDCDSNGISDIIDLSEGNATDCNQNGVLDICDVANASINQWAAAVLDFSSQFAGRSWSAAQTLGEPDVFVYGDVPRAWAPQPRNGSLEFVQVAFDLPVYADGVTVRETFGNAMVYRVELLDVHDNTHVIWEGVDPSPQDQPVDFRIDWPRTSYLVQAVTVRIDTDANLSHWEEIDAIALHGAPISLADCNQNNLPDECDADFDANGIPDACEPNFTDCNSNGVDDGLDIAEGAAFDCNSNMVPDACDVADGFSGDCDGDLRPDECDPDCNGNGASDVCDVLDGISNDCDMNSVPDECGADGDGDGLIDACDICPDSDSVDLISIDQCQTAAANGPATADGCTMADEIALCEQQAETHGAFVSCVVQLTRLWRQNGWIDLREMARIRRCAASSNIHSPSGSPSHNAAPPGWLNRIK